MDIARLSMSLAQIDTSNAVGTKVLGMTMKQSEQQGEQLVQMLDAAAMERSVNPAVGGHFDMSV